MADQTSFEPETAQIKVIFTSTDEDFQLPDVKRQLVVPADIRRYGLSRILNSESMLNTPRAVPFDFLINGSFLTSSLEDYINQQGLSLESTLTLQYVKSLIPPVYEASFEHDDWVSAVDVLSESSPAGRWAAAAAGSSFNSPDRILSASYDGHLRMWNASGQVVATSPGPAAGGHSASIKSAKFLSATQVVSAGMDHTVRVWNYSEGGRDDGNAAATGSFKPVLELYGHRGGMINSVEVDGPSRRILTAGGDGTVALWTTSKSSAPEAATTLLPGAASSNKRRRVQSSVTVAQRGPLAQMPLHKEPVSAAVFDPRDRTVAYSASLDHTICTVDLTTAQVVSTITTAAGPLLSLCALPNPGSTTTAPLLAAGTTTRNVVLVDPRQSAAATSVMTLRDHVNFVSAVAPSGTSDHALVSASHDGTCRVWDLRAASAAVTVEAVYVIDRESLSGRKRPVAGDGCKVFDVVWDRTWGIVSCGEDKMVQVNRGRDIMAS